MNSKQVVLITGSSTGFGRLFANTLARKGHTVFATMRDPGGRNAKNASEIRALAEKHSLPIYVLELDVTDDVDTTGFGDGGIDSPLDRGVVSTSPSTTPATSSRGWRKLSPPNKR